MKINEQPPITSPTLGPASGPNGPAGRRALGPAATEAGTAGPTGAPAAKVELSNRSRELHEALRAANATPDVREDVVADVRTRIENGTYRVDAGRIARGILDTVG